MPPRPGTSTRRRPLRPPAATWTARLRMQGTRPGGRACRSGGRLATTARTPAAGPASTGSTGRTPGRASAPAESDTTESVADLTPADVTLTTIRKTYGDVVAVDSIDLEIARGEFFTMLGPSGSG